MYKILHNPRCSKCRECLKILEDSGIRAGKDLTVIEYLQNPPSEGELELLLDQLNLSPEQIVRKSEDRYEELNLKQNPPANRKAWIKLLCENPILIERPIVSNGKRAVLGRPPENVKKII